MIVLFRCPNYFTVNSQDLEFRSRLVCMVLCQHGDVWAAVKRYRFAACVSEVKTESLMFL